MDSLYSMAANFLRAREISAQAGRKLARMHSNSEPAVRSDSIPQLTGSHLGRMWIWLAQACGYEQVETISTDSEASCHTSGSKGYFLLRKRSSGDYGHLLMLVPVPQVKASL